MIAQRMRQSLGSDYLVVSAPDHPLLLRSPDLIVGGQGHLLAIICATAREARQPDLARARLTLARAALPPETSFAFVATPYSDTVAHEIATDVDAVLTLRDIDDLVKVGKSDASLRLTRDREQARVKAMQRFGRSYRIAQTLNPDELTVDRASRRLRKRSGALYQGIENGIARAEFLHSPNATDLANLVLNGARRAFSLDSGVSYPVGHSGLAYADDIPVAQGDPNRYIRAAAFSGWVLAPSSLEVQHARLANMILRTEDKL